MKKIVIAALMLALCITVAVPALAEGVRDANAAYNELLAGFNGKYPDEYAGAYGIAHMRRNARRGCIEAETLKRKR